MNYLKGKNFYNWFGVFMVIVGCLVFWTTTLIIPRETPNNSRIDLTNVAGRIVPRDQVKPGTFAIERPFDSIWDRTSIMAYEYSKSAEANGYTDSIFLEVWQPDLNSSGVFLHSQKEVGFEYRSGFYHVDLIKHKQSLIVMYIPDIGVDHGFYALIAGAMLIVVGGIFYIAPRSWT